MADETTNTEDVYKQLSDFITNSKTTKYNTRKKRALKGLAGLAGLTGNLGAQFSKNPFAEDTDSEIDTEEES